jgi:ankyrin repeat protein
MSTHIGSTPSVQVDVIPTSPNDTKSDSEPKNEPKSLKRSMDAVDGPSNTRKKMKKMKKNENKVEKEKIIENTKKIIDMYKYMSTETFENHTLDILKEGIDAEYKTECGNTVFGNLLLNYDLFEPEDDEDVFYDKYVELVKTFLSMYTVDINYPGVEGHSYLLSAVYIDTERNEPKLTKLLLDHGARSPDALAHACSHLNLPLVNMLLAVDGIDVKNSFALHAACSASSRLRQLYYSPSDVPDARPIIDALLQHKDIDINQILQHKDIIEKDDVGKTPLHIAVEDELLCFHGYKHKTGITKMLCAHKDIDVNIVNDRAWKCDYVNRYIGKETALQLALFRYTQPIKSDITAMLDIVTSLLSKNADIYHESSGGKSSFWHAMRHLTDTKIIDMMKEKDPQKWEKEQGKYRLNEYMDNLLQECPLEDVQKFIAWGGHANKVFGGCTLLGHAAALGKANVVQFLLENGANPKHKCNPLAMTTRIYAARFAHGSVCSENAQELKNLKKVIEMLLTHGANPNHKNFQGRTSLDIATTWEYDPELVDLLVQAGAKKSNELK